MIGKVIRRKKKVMPSIHRLNDYVANYQPRPNEDRKVLFAGSLNLGDVDIATATFMMTCDAQRNTKSKDPVLHCLLSWKEGEQPSEEQTREAVQIALEELGLVGQPCVYGLHKNTGIYHAHISVSRIDRETYRMKRANGGWTQKAMERAARRVEHAQGWDIAPNAWSTIGEDGVIHETPKTEHPEKKIPQEVKDIENITGEKSAMRIAKEALSKHKFASWDELHKTLSELGMRYEKKGSGAVIVVGDVPIKASSAGKRFALSYLEKTLGEFTEADRFTKVNTSKQHIIEPLAVGTKSEWEEYAQKRDEYYRSKRVVKERMMEKIAEERKELAARQRKERTDFFTSQNWKGRRREMNMKQSEYAAKHKGEKLDLAERHAEMRKRFYDMYPTFPRYEEWLRDRERHQEAEEWRNRNTQTANTVVSIFPDAPPEQNKIIKDIRGFKPKEHKYGLLFTDPSNGRNAFMDTGKSIRVYSNDDSSILAAMQLASQKWGTIQLSGTEEYKRKCLTLAVENGIKITNPELQEEYKKLSHKGEEQVKSIDPKSAEHAKDLFRQYHEAVGAERYKVTATQLNADGSKRGFMVNKRDGAPDGFTPEELDGKMYRLMSLMGNDNRNIYYTPISDDKHHILIDDMTNDTLAELIVDGYEPAAIIESSPGNWQAVITIPKLGTDMDRAIGNEIVSRLNKQYGDPKVSGEIHAHRAPGFENRKPKHQREDGTYPEVKLAKAEKVECQKTIALAKEVFAELEARRRETSERLDRITASLPSGSLPMATAKAYELHFRDVMRIQERISGERGKQLPDVSRIDGMVAVRLRATGHSKEDIQAAVEVMSPKLREAIGSKGTHVWPDYAARTAAYAFGYSGDKSISQREKYVAHWKEMERAAIQKSRPPRERTSTREDDMER